MYYLRVALLAPGVVLHELAHHLLCLLTGVRVRRAVYFRPGSPAGFVIHDEPELYRQIFAIVAGPFFLNTTVSVALLNLALRQWVRAMDPAGFGVVALMAWVGVSAALQAIPSRADAGNLLRSSNWHLLHGNPFAVIGYPVALAIYLIQLAGPLGSEWLYALFLAFVAYRGFTWL